MITEAMLSKANEAYFNSRGNDVEKLRAALEAIESELLAQGMEKEREEILMLFPTYGYPMAFPPEHEQIRHAIKQRGETSAAIRVSAHPEDKP